MHAINIANVITRDHILVVDYVLEFILRERVWDGATECRSMAKSFSGGFTVRSVPMNFRVL